MKFLCVDWPFDCSHSILVGVLFGVAVLQWFLLLPLAVKKGLIHGINYDSVKNVATKIPLAKDIWFILWNLLPFALLACYAYMWYNWGEWAASLAMLVHPDPEATLAQVDTFFASPVIPYVVLAIAVFAAIAQIPKQIRYIQASGTGDKSNDRAYWWDWRISRLIFAIRFLALPFNMFTVLMVALMIVRILTFLSLVAFSCEAVPALFHPDGMGGFSVVGSLAMAAAIPCIIYSGCGVVAIIDHKGQGLTHSASDVASILMLLPAIWITTVPLLIIDHKVGREHAKLAEASNALGAEALEEAQRVVKAEGREGLTKWVDTNAERLQLTSAMMRRPKYPLDTDRILQLIVSWLMPLLLYSTRRPFKREEPDASVVT